MSVTGADARRGFALVAALWATTLLSTVALAIALDERSERRASQNRVDVLRARAAAEGGVAHAHSILSRLAIVRGGTGVNASTPVDPWQEIALYGDSANLGAAAYRITLQDAGARLNVNRADEEEIARLLLAVHVDARTADRIAQCILDWRDADDAHRARGAERADYDVAGMPLPPANRAFLQIGELRRVLGVTPELFGAIEPYVTVDGSGRISPHTAPPEVLLSLRGMTPESVMALLELRRHGRRVGHIAELAPNLSQRSSAELLRHTAELSGRLSLETTEVVALVHAAAGTSGPHVSARAVFVRSSGRAAMTGVQYR